MTTPKRLSPWIVPAVLAMCIPAWPASPAGQRPDFGGYWVISKDDTPNNPAFGRTDPGGMPQGWIGFNGYTAHGNALPHLRPDLIDELRRYIAREVGGLIQEEGSRKRLPSNNFA
jgi:hypothetical protein